MFIVQSLEDTGLLLISCNHGKVARLLVFNAQHCSLMGREGWTSSPLVLGRLDFYLLGKKQSAPTPATQAKKCLNIREIKKVALAYTGTDPYLGTPLKSGSCGLFSRSSLPIFY